MANTAAILSAYLKCQSDINWLVTLQTKASNAQDATSKKLAKYAKYEEQWETAYDDCYYAEEGSQVKIGSTEYRRADDSQAIAYAYAKVAERDETIYLQLTEEDMDYDTLNALYEAQLTKKRAELDALKPLVSEAAADTGITSS